MRLQTTNLASANRPLIIFTVSWCSILLVPLIPVAPWLQTFMHTWRAELAVSLLCVVFLIRASRSLEFQSFLTSFSNKEKYLILLPMAAFTGFSFLSMVWAVSLRSAFLHSALWVCYLTLYLLFRYFLARNRSAHDIMITAAIVVTAIICLPALFEYYSFVIFGEATTIGLRYAKYAEAINVFLPLIAAFALQGSSKKFVVGTASIVLILVFDISTLSRAAMGIAIISIVLFSGVIFMVRRFAVYRRRLALMGAIVTAGVIFAIIPSFITSANVPIIERVKDESSAQSSNVRPFFSLIAFEMVKDRPLVGVGGDNFGLEFNKYRAKYAKENQGDPNLSIAEHQIPERAHNEFSQVAAELGLAGFAIFLWFMAGIAILYVTAVKKRLNISLPAFAALVGIAGFLLSSLVSSFSFRIVQNALVFFFALAVAGCNLLPKEQQFASSAKRLQVLRFAFYPAIASSILLAVFCLTRAASVYYLFQTAHKSSIEESISLFEQAISLDRENASIHSTYGISLLNAGRYNEAVEKLEDSIRFGRSTTADYSYLATAEALAGDPEAAESTLSEATQIYPQSVFIRTRYAVLLKDQGKFNESAYHFSIAKQQDEGQASTWWNLIDAGGRVASQRAFNEKLPEVMRLFPSNAIYAVVAEREIRFPEEKNQIPFY